MFFHLSLVARIEAIPERFLDCRPLEIGVSSLYVYQIFLLFIAANAWSRNFPSVMIEVWVVRISKPRLFSTFIRMNANLSSKLKLGLGNGY